MRHAKGTGGRRQKGFSLIELLIVVTLVGIIAMIMTIAVSKTLKRQRLETAAHQFRSFIERAYVDSKLEASAIFFEIGPPNASGERAIRLLRDGGDGWYGTPPNPPGGANDDVQLDRQVLTGDIVLATAGNTWGGLNQFPTNGTVFVLGCRTDGRPYNPLFSPGATVIMTPTRISLTHREMAEIPPKLNPTVRYDITVSPLWRPTSDKVNF